MKSSRRNPPQVRVPKVAPRYKPTKKVTRQPTPQSELGLTVDLTINWSSKHETRESDIVIKGSKPFADISPTDHVKLFMHKVTECTKICDFSSPKIDSKAKTTKTLLLKHLIASFSLTTFIKQITPEMMTAFYNMIGANIFRTMPPQKSISPIETNDAYYDSAWPHLELCYQLLTASLSCSLTQTMTSSFIYKVILNSISLDPYERSAVRDFLHNFYQRYMSLRITVRKHIYSLFSMGSASPELIDFYASVVSGFNSPLKQEHVKFYHEAVLPLLTSNYLPKFSENITNCIHNFIDKHPTLLHPSLKFILEKWPKTDSKKQVIFLNLNLDILITYGGQSIESTKMGFKTIAAGVVSDHADVSDAALNCILDNDAIVGLLEKNSEILFPLLFEPLYKSAKGHWDRDIKDNSLACLQMLSELGPSTFQKLNAERKSEKAKAAAASAENKQGWLAIFNQAKMSDTLIKTLKIEAVPQ